MQTIIILDFGSQYTQLIARKIRELNVYCEIHAYNKIPTLTPDVKGVVLSGSPYSCNDAQAPIPDLSQIKGRLPRGAIRRHIIHVSFDHLDSFLSAEPDPEKWLPQTEAYRRKSRYLNSMQRKWVTISDLSILIQLI